VPTNPHFPAPPALGSAPSPVEDEETTGIREARKQVAHRLVAAIVDLSGPERDALFKIIAIWLQLNTSARYAVYTVACEFRDLLNAAVRNARTQSSVSRGVPR
jgi:CRISPR/Cas system endoribonuclease Cas6 (RAMP superfamily)